MREYIYYDNIDTIDNTVFTEERVLDWKMHILSSYRHIYKILKSQLRSDSMIEFFVDESLVDEAIVDAVIGMKKLTDSSNNSVEDPNAFKIASYLAYWWLRHKPASVHYPKGYRTEFANLAKEQGNMSDEAYEAERLKLVWRLKHINEMIAVHMVMTYIFDFSRPICGKSECKKITAADQNSFPFADFDEMKRVILDKLLYYFSYRTIAPKVIEHLLEAYTFHPAWKLTGMQWAAKEISAK